MEIVLELESLSISQAGKILVPAISLTLLKGQNLAITGSAGSGKSSLALALLGKVHYQGHLRYSAAIKSIAWVEQQHHFKNRSNTSSFYYQQRFNSFDADDAITVREYLGENPDNIRDLTGRLELDYLLDKPLIQLSNGENKKIQLLLAIKDNPDLIIMDQPFVGLDNASRIFLNALIDELTQDGKTIILITQPHELPESITHVISLSKNGPASFETRQDFERKIQTESPVLMEDNSPADKIAQLTSASHAVLDFPVIVMKGVSVKYGDREILTDINWKIEEGERWLLSGPNGAGKSTLLSLITADNPQAYANTIELFGRRRGSGETIWEIKKKIGYLSPEMHLYFETACSGFEAVASGLFDTIGLFRQLDESQIQLVNQWMDLTGISSLKQKMLHQLSLGEQRMILLTRALVKDAQLLILDEPCQGLDEETENRMIRLIDQICLVGNKTLIYVTHYANRRPDCISKMLQIEHGKAQYIGDIK